MPVGSKYLFIASMDVEPDKEALFNEIYDKEHIPYVSEVPGVLSVVRFQTRSFKVSIGGEVRTVEVGNEPKYSAFYELESADILAGDAFGTAVEKGRWAQDVRPYTKNRRHVLMEIIQPG